MANKYQSTLRTFMAKELVWKTGADPFADTDLPVLAAPADLVIADTHGASPNYVNACVEQPYRANWGNMVGWNINSTLNVKRVGLFSNFADGLVFYGYPNRLGLQLRAYTMYTTSTPLGAGVIKIAQGFNTIESDVVDLRTLDFFLQTSGLTFDSGYLYRLYNAQVGGIGFKARLSANGYADNNASPIINVFPKVTVSNVVTFPLIEIPTLNSMYDIEQYVDLTTLPASPYTTGSDATIVLTAQVVKFPNDNYDGTDEPFKFFTKTIDTDFNTNYVSFDSMIDVEVTPV